MFIRSNTNESDCPRVVIYINIRLSSLHFSIQKDIIDCRDILLASFSNNGDIFWLMNVYSDAPHSTLKYLKDTEVNIQNLLIMAGDFNIRDSLWNSSFPHHSSISNDLIIITDSFHLSLLSSTNQVPTRCVDNLNNTNLIIDLMFLWCNSSKLNNYFIHSEWCLSSNHALLTVMIIILNKIINIRKSTIQKNSVEELFVKNIISAIKNLDVLNLLDIPSLEKAVNNFVKNVDNVWSKNMKLTNITKHSKSLWDDNCSRDLERYKSLKRLENWRSFHKTVKNTKRIFFNLKITEIANKKQGLWELMS